MADPYQFHRSITTLQAAGLPIREFAQTTANTTLMGQTLFDLLTGKNLVVYPSDELRQQALSTVAIENPRGWRIAKEKSSKKIDAIVALTMACCAAMAHRGELGSRVARGFNRNAHVAILEVSKHFPVFIGQTFETPATVIAQVDGTSIRVLAAFANADMSLQRHCAETVAPWIAAHAANMTFFGTYEALSDKVVEYDLTRYLRETVPGNWQPTTGAWETRKETMLNFLGKVEPFTFKPALQIDAAGAKLLVEALSGRWSYEKDRRDKRNIWFYVASAFSLIVARAASTAKRPESKKPAVKSTYDILGTGANRNSQKPKGIYGE